MSDIETAARQKLTERRARLPALEAEVARIRGEIALLEELLGDQQPTQIVMPYAAAPTVARPSSGPNPRVAARGDAVEEIVRGHGGRAVPQITIIKAMQERSPEFTRNHLITILDKDPRFVKVDGAVSLRDFAGS